MDIFAAEKNAATLAQQAGDAARKRAGEIGALLDTSKTMAGKDPKDSLFESLVDKHLDPKREKAAQDGAPKEGKSPSKEAGASAAEDLSAAIEGEAVAVDGVPQPAPDAPKQVVVDDMPKVVSEPIIETAKSTGVDAASAEELASEGAKADQQILATGMMPNTPAPEGAPQKMTAAERLRANARTTPAPEQPQVDTQSTKPNGGNQALPANTKVSVENPQFVSRPAQTLAQPAAPQPAPAQPAQAPQPTPAQPVAAADPLAENLSAETGGNRNANAGGNTGQNNPNTGQSNTQQPAVPLSQTAAAQRADAARAAAAQAASQNAARGGEAPQAPQPSTPSTPALAGGTQQTAQAQQARQSAPTHAPQQSRAALQNQQVADQVAVQIQRAVRNGLDRITVQLKPAELGRIEITMEVAHDGRVNAVVQADKPETLELLMKDAKYLERALQDAGLRADANSLSFKMRGEQGDDGKSGGSEMEKFAGEGESEDELAALTNATGLTVGGDGTVDIRV